MSSLQAACVVVRSFLDHSVFLQYVESDPFDENAIPGKKLKVKLQIFCQLGEFLQLLLTAQIHDFSCQIVRPKIAPAIDRVQHIVVMRAKIRRIVLVVESLKHTHRLTERRLFDLAKIDLKVSVRHAGVDLLQIALDALTV